MATRSLLFAFAALPMLAACPAFAQVVQTGPGKVATGPASLPSVEPLSRHASNITNSDTRSVIAPALPAGDVGSNATATTYLHVALTALAAKQTGRAQVALEDAETLLLTRSVPQGAVNTADQNPAVNNIDVALQSLAANNLPDAMSLVQQTIPMTE